MILAAKCAETELQALEEDFAATIFNYFKSKSAVFSLIIFKTLPLLDRMPAEKKEIFNPCWKQNHICLRSPSDQMKKKTAFLSSSRMLVLHMLAERRILILKRAENNDLLYSTHDSTVTLVLTFIENDTLIILDSTRSKA